MGTTIASLVETTDTWVEANFKETQLAALAAGMPVEVTVDAYPGVKFEGHLDSIGAATGSEFALIPAQNATGNWVKVTQRVPVRVEVTPVEESQYLVAKVAYRARITDAVQDLLYTPVIRAVGACAQGVRRAHTGSMHLYLVYGALGLLIVLLVAR